MTPDAESIDGQCKHLLTFFSDPRDTNNYNIQVSPYVYIDRRSACVCRGVNTGCRDYLLQAAATGEENLGRIDRLNLKGDDICGFFACKSVHRLQLIGQTADYLKFLKKFIASIT